jgi:hypothetical protein
MPGIPAPIPELQGVKVDDWPAWLSEHSGELSDDSIERLQTWVQEQDFTGYDESWQNSLRRAVTEDVQAEGGARTDKTYTSAVDEVEGALQSGQTPNPDLDRDGTVTTGERKALSDARTKVTKDVTSAAQQQAEASGATEEQAATAVAESQSALDSLFSETEVPVPATLGAFVGPNGKLKATDSHALIEAWNVLNPASPVKTEADLLKVMRVDGPVQQQVVEIAFLGAEPLIDYRIPTIAGDSYTVSADTFNLLSRQYGYTTAQMTSAVRAAAKAGLTDGRGDPAWQVLLGLANATRNQALLTPIAETPVVTPGSSPVEMQGINAGTKPKTTTTSGGYTASISGLNRGEADEYQKQRQQEAAAADAARKGNQAASYGNYWNAQTLQALGVEFKNGRDFYGGDDMLGLLHVVNPSLAARIATTDPKNLSLADKRTAAESFMDMGLDDQALMALGYGWVSNYDTYGQRTSGGGGGSEPTRQQPDPVALRQAAKDLYTGLFVAEPSEAQLDQLTASVMSAINAAPMDQTVDPNARLRAAAEGLPQYQELYANKPGGMSAEEYQSGFRQGAASILGNASVDPSVIQGGLRTGKTQTSVGAAAASKPAWESSGFLGRLAAAAQVVAEST